MAPTWEDPEGGVGAEACDGGVGPGMGARGIRLAEGAVLIDWTVAFTSYPAHVHGIVKLLVLIVEGSELA